MLRLTRREFLGGAAAATLSLSLGALVPACRSGDGNGSEPVAGKGERLLPSPPAYGDWRDVYREKWSWDRVAKGTHHVNCWYQRGCNWNVFVKDGFVLREEQVGAYPQTNADVPDFNPAAVVKRAPASALASTMARGLPIL